MFAVKKNNTTILGFKTKEDAEAFIQRTRVSSEWVVVEVECQDNELCNCVKCFAKKQG